jgi:hypothetical protein
VTALIGIAANLRTVLAAHVPFQFVNGRCLWSADDVQRHGLMSVTAEAADLKIEISSVQRVAEAGRGLSRSFESEHALVPGDTRQTVSFLPSLGRALRRMPNRTAVDALSRLGAHPARMRQLGFDRQAATSWAFSASAHKARWSGRSCLSADELQAKAKVLGLMYGLKKHEEPNETEKASFAYSQAKCWTLSQGTGWR